MGLQDTVESADTAPTAQSYEVCDELKAQLDIQLSAWREVQGKDLPALNALMEQDHIPAIAAFTPKPVAKTLPETLEDEDSDSVGRHHHEDRD
jgi:hypothetical protein